MSVSGLTTEEISQPLSESYLHLSSDSLSTGTLESLEEMTQSISSEMTRLIQLAQDIDREQGDAVEESTEKLDTRNKEVPYTNGGASDEDERSSEESHSDVNNNEPSFSSHSTPIISRRAMRDNLNKTRRRALMRSIQEVEDDSISSKFQAKQDEHPKKDTKPPFSLDEICRSLKPLLSKELTQLKEIKESIQMLMKQQNNSSYQRSNMYTTPQKTRDPEHGTSSSANEEDRLSLSDMINKLDIEEQNHDEQETDADDSPITTPPLSQDTKDTANIRTDETFTDRAEQGRSYDLSYIPKNLEEKRQAEKKVYSRHSVDQRDQIADLEQEIDRLKREANFFKQENLNLKIHVNDLEIKMSETQNQDVMDLTSDTINFDDLKEKNTKGSTLHDNIRQLMVKNSELTAKLQRSQENNKELVNELNWFKGRYAKAETNRMQTVTESVKDPLVDSLEFPDPSSVRSKVSNINKRSDSHILESNKSEIRELKKTVAGLQAEVGDKSSLLSKDGVAKDFRAHYTKLGLHKVDSMSKVELANLVKNLMLSLLICDIDNLPDKSVNLGKYLKLSISFLDTLHSLIYQQSGPVKPSSYIKAVNSHDTALGDLQSCLNGMIEHIKSSQQGA